MNGDLPAGQVTFLFTDIEGSTNLWDAFPGAMHQALSVHNVLLTDAIGRHGGAVVKDTGDGLFAAFAEPTAAVAAAVDAQQRLAAAVWPKPELRLSVRMALHTTEISPRAGDYHGSAVNRVARIEAAGHGGQVLISGSTHALVERGLPDGVVAAELGVFALRGLSEPERIHQLVIPGLPSAFPPLRTGAADRSYPPLPPEGPPLIGRADDVEAVLERLVRPGLLTLVGAGGSGKTRLALHVAHRRAPHTPVWFIEFGSINAGGDVADRLFAGFGLPDVPDLDPLDAVVDELRDRGEGLVVLDNCEHVIDGVVDVVASLLRSVPDLSILATSREMLGVRGEQVWQVHPLSLPEGSTTDSILEADACALFVDRARAVAPSFDPTRHEADIATICRRLDGLPLGIELAAARVAGMSPADIVEGLTNRFHLLDRSVRTSEHGYRALGATVDWSYRLLDDEERSVLERVSIFAGRFGSSAAGTVAGWGRIRADDVGLHLAALAEKSLIAVVDSEHETTYRLLETIREFARAKLIEVGDHDETVERYVDHYVSTAPTIERFGMSEQWWKAIAWVDREFGNLDDVSSRLDQAGDTRRSLILTGALARLITTVGRYGLIADRINRAGDLTEKSAVDPALRAKIQMILAVGAGYLPLEECVANGEEAYGYYRSSDHEAGAAWTCFSIATTYSMVADFDNSAVWAERAAMHAIRSGWDFARAWIVPGHLVYQLIRARLDPTSIDVDLIADELERARSIVERVGNPELSAVVRASTATARLLLGVPPQLDEVSRPAWFQGRPSPLAVGFDLMRATVAIAVDDADAAQEAIVQAMESIRIGRISWMAWSFAELLAVVAMMRGETDESARLVGCHGESHEFAFGYGSFFFDFTVNRRALHEAIGDDAVRRLGAEGRLLGARASIDRYLRNH